MIRKLLVVNLMLLLRACGTQSTSRPASTLSSGTSQAVVSSTDMGSDDWIAVLYLLNRADVQVLAITVTGAGLAHAEPESRSIWSLTPYFGH